jgi:peptidoglycan/xylan/chitin deacetylase (PgdA/CDA1 family)
MTEPRTQTPNLDADRVGNIPTRIMKVTLALLFLPLLEIWRLGRQLNGKPPISVVIYYHRVLSRERVRFGRQMDRLRRWSTPMRVSDEGRLSSDSRSVLVTFDDGWQSFYEVALPEIERRQIPVVVFLISGRLGQILEAGCAERLMTEEELRSVAGGLVTIGSHTDSHARMPGLPENAARHELRTSREKLSRIIGREVSLFCFPFGAADPESIRLCREEGYLRAFTGIPERLRSNKFAIGRVRVDPSDWTIEYFLKIVGAYIWVPAAITAKSRLRSWGFGAVAKSQLRASR